MYYLKKLLILIGMTDEKSINGQVVVVMGPTGSGKGTLIKHILEEIPTIEHTISVTTRKPRDNEVDGREYYFWSDSKFKDKVKAGDFLEWAEFAGFKYGTLKSEIIPRLKSNKVVIMEIDLQGVEQLLKLIPRNNITLVYIDAGDWETMRARALARAPISKSDLEKRHTRFLIESQAKSKADYIIDNSGSLEVALMQLRSVFKSVFNKTEKR